MSAVFEPIQQQFAAHIAGHDCELAAYRRALFAHYLSSPTSSLAFPSTTNAPSLLLPPPSPPCPEFRYSTAAITAADPTLSTLIQQQQDAPSSAPAPSPLQHRERVIFDAGMWDKLEATPYGRYNSLPSTPLPYESIEAAVRERMRRLGWEQYSFDTESGAAYDQHFGSHSGKRIIAGRRGGGVAAGTAAAAGRHFNIISNQ